MDNTLGIEEIWRIIAAISGQGKAARIKAYLDAIARANKDSLQEAFSMHDTEISLLKTFEEIGVLATLEAKVEPLYKTYLMAKYKAEMEAEMKAEISAKIEAEYQARIEAEIRAKIKAEYQAEKETRYQAEGEEHKAVTIAQNMINLGLPLEIIISATNLEPETVKALYQSD